MSKISKKLRKTLAIVLAFAMVASVAIPSAPAQAAAKKYAKSLKVSPSKVTLTAGAKKTVKATVKVSGNAKKNVTVKSSNKGVVTVKTKKANKKGVSEITLTAKNVTSKKSAKITVTTSAKNKKGKKIKKTINVTVNPKASTGGKTTPKPATTYRVTKVDAINPSTGEVTLTFDSKVAASTLTGTTLTIKGDNNATVTATFSKVSADGYSATYVIPKSDLGKVTTGNYTITTSNASVVIPSTVGSTSAKVQIDGSSVKGFVYDVSDPDIPIKSAQVTIGGSTVITDRVGFYQKAITAGNYENISVKAAGYFDESKAKVKVVDNHASAYNFEMERYDISKVYICGTVTDSDNSQIPVEGATVVLYEDGKVKATLKTDASGHYVFANNRATVKNFDTTSKRTFSYSTNIRLDKTYNIVITKDLAKNNLDDVYKPVDTGKINLGSARNVNIDRTMKKVAPVEEITMNLSWAEDTTLKSADSTKVKVKFVDVDGETELVAAKEIDLEDCLNAEYNGFKDSKVYKLAAEDYFGTGKNTPPTLPSGTYYLIITDVGADGAQVNATTVVPVAVTEGSTARPQANIVPAVSRNVNYTAYCTDKYGETALKNQGAVLKKVTDDKGTLGAANITVTAKVYQVVSGKKVLVRSNPGISLNKGENNAYAYNDTIENLAANQQYSVETLKTNLTAEPGTIQKDNNKPVNIDLAAAANVVKVKMRDANCFYDSETSDKVAASTEQVMVNSITVTGKAAVGGTVTATAPINTKYTLAQLVSGISINKDELKGLKPGKYTVTWNIDGYKLSSSDTKQDDEQDVIDLQDATMVCEATYEKVYPTTITGAIIPKVIADNTTKLSADGLAVLYSSDLKKIVAANSLYTAENGAVAYKLEDGVNGNFGKGSYKLIIRAKGIDILTKDITISAANTIYKNQDFANVEVGGNSAFQVPIKTNLGTVLGSGAVVEAYDDYYKNPYDLSVVDNLAAGYLLAKSGYIGGYTFSRADATAETWTLNNIPKGAYKVVVESDDTVRTTITRNVSGTNTEAITVSMLTYADLVKIQLSIKNHNSSFAANQIDFITVESKDGKVYRYGNIRRTASEETVVFYVPKNQGYTVSVYSSGSCEGITPVTTQSKENEKVYVNCAEIE